VYEKEVENAYKAVLALKAGSYSVRGEELIIIVVEVPDLFYASCNPERQS